jgi:hypothetical protein
MSEGNTLAVGSSPAAARRGLEDTALDERDRERLAEKLSQGTWQRASKGRGYIAADESRRLTPMGKVLLYAGRIPTTLAAIGAFFWLLVEVVLSLFGAPGLMDNWAVLGVFLGVYVLWAICLFTPMPTAVDKEASAAAVVLGLPDRAAWS